MGIKVHNISTGEAVAVFDWNDDLVHVTYDPNRHTPALEAKFARSEERGWATLVMAEFIQIMVTKWDVFGTVEFPMVYPRDSKGKEIRTKDQVPDYDNGKLVDSDEMFPIEQQYLKYLPSQFLAKCFEAIMDAMAPKEEEEKGE